MLFLSLNTTFVCLDVFLHEARARSNLQVHRYNCLKVCLVPEHHRQELCLICHVYERDLPTILAKNIGDTSLSATWDSCYHRVNPAISHISLENPVLIEQVTPLPPDSMLEYLMSCYFPNIESGGRGDDLWKRKLFKNTKCPSIFDDDCLNNEKSQQQWRVRLYDEKEDFRKINWYRKLKIMLLQDKTTASYYLQQKSMNFNIQRELIV